MINEYCQDKKGYNTVIYCYSICRKIRPEFGRIFYIFQLMKPLTYSICVLTDSAAGPPALVRRQRQLSRFTAS